ncbi:MAG: nickel pincer cofactor biosynthesis protein LarC [Lachnospiraceae bacterium]|nr:nickel pincer cofactor biosynthesis protein LarC [Lachnospiraceae bacterium]
MSQTILYLECSSGISGDMSVAALLDLGADRKVLTSALASLPLSGYSIEIKDVLKSGIRACDFHVILEKDNHDHDMQYLHGSSSIPGEHTHTEHTHPEHHHAHSHHDARNLNDIIEIIQAGILTDSARELAIRIFHILAEAEAFVHGKSIEEVHFHEVGAVDSIVDIVAFAVCLDNLQPDRIVVSALTDGTGQIRCQHGLIPVPVPAVTAIASIHGLPLKISAVEGELVTPTGAAIAAALMSDEKLPSEFRILKTGFGAGKRDYATAGFLRAMLLRPVKEEMHDTILTLETNIDDCTGEALSFTMKQLLEAGALDAFFVPIYMKKNRPAQLLKVICKPEDRQKMEAIIFRNTTTIGIRIQELQRTKLERRILAVETPWGMADVKCCAYGEDTYYYPENDSVCQLAQLAGYGFSEMYSMIQAYVRQHVSV